MAGAYLRRRDQREVHDMRWYPDNPATHDRRLQVGVEFVDVGAQRLALSDCMQCRSKFKPSRVDESNVEAPDQNVSWLRVRTVEIPEEYEIEGSIPQCLVDQDLLGHGQRGCAHKPGVQTLVKEVAAGAVQLPKTDGHLSCVATRQASPTIHQPSVPPGSARTRKPKDASLAVRA
jgi:hypothetical protein